MVDGWTVFASGETACFARKVVSANAILVLGKLRDSGDFVLGLSGKLPGTEDRTLSIVFDGIRTKRPYVEGGSRLVTGRYGADADLVEEISRSATLQVSGKTSPSLTFPLDGTRAAMAAVNDCVRSMLPRDFPDQSQDIVLPDKALCEDKPQNGQILAKHGGLRKRGHKLTIRNSSQGDAIIKVRHEASRKLAYSFLVYRNDVASISGIADGRYRIQFAYGQTLLENCSDFDKPQASEFERSVLFDTKVEKTRKSVTTYTTDFTATLYAVKDGNAPTFTIGLEDFLKD
ncbi:MAG: hypothetical protein M9939_07590 [Mesorhizobium sp.]|nr:hypothetical protein [Mesorhizobium sp.]MCO5160983.1 hypothetical protein [Mesorhizobium sp.]